jgi:hypothetical protein
MICIPMALIHRKEGQMKNFTTAFSSKVLMAVSAFFLILGITMIDSAGAGEKKKITYTKTSTKDISRNDVNPGDNPKHKMTQSVRIDIIKYSDPDFGSSKDWVYVQSDSYAGTGTNRGYTISNYENGDQTYQKWEGTHQTAVKENGGWESKYEGTYQFLGGTGKFENIKGNGVYRGTITPKGLTEEGEATIEY